MKRANRSRRKKAQARTRSPRRVLLLLIGAAAISLVAFVFGKLSAPRPSSAILSDRAAGRRISPSVDGSQPADAKTLVGRWVRIDTPYVFEISSVDNDGTLKAGYYNPRSINISRAEATDSQGDLKVFVELRDVNYPCSTYDLTYDQKRDLLCGVYFQAVTGQKYNVIFGRAGSQS